MGSSNSGVAGSSGGSMHASFHPSIANLAALPGPLFKLSQVLRGCPPPPVISTALAAHLSRNNTRSNYITLSGKGAVALPASNLFSLSLYTFHETFSNLWPKSAKSDPRPQTLGKRRGGKKRERRQSAKVASFHFNTFFPFPFDV